MNRHCRHFLLLLSLLLALPAAAQTTLAKVGQRWEFPLSSDHALSCGNRSRIPVLTVTYTSPTGVTYTGYGFWDTGNTFKIRAVFPSAGTWKWTTNFTSNGCGSHPLLTVTQPRDITVTASGTGQVALYTQGALKVSGTPPARYLTHNSGLPFYWLGDTNWSFIKATPALWTQYLAARKSQGFTVIQVSVPTSGATTQNTDYAGNTPFNAGACTEPLPNTCSEMNPPFWTEFDRKIQEANAAGFLVVVIGLFKRVTIGDWPALAESEIYTRNIVARLSGNHVIFSPGFDELPNKTANCEDLFDGANCDARNPATINCGQALPCPTGRANQACRARVIGRRIRDSLIRTASGVRLSGLITHHFGGGCKCSGQECTSDYFHKKFELEDWLDFTLFQSGQGMNCFLSGTEPQRECMAQRARQRPFDIYTRALKANVNGEGIYDNGAVAPALYSDYTARQAGYLSTLSGAFGYTFGVSGIWNWGASGAPQPEDRWGSASSLQMKTLCTLFRNLEWQRLKPAPSTQILNQSPTESTKMVYAYDPQKTFALAYMPQDPSRTFIQLETVDSGYTGGWCHKWLDPATGIYSDSITPPQGSGTVITFTKPNASKDWILVFKAPGQSCTPVKFCPCPTVSAGQYLCSTTP